MAIVLFNPTNEQFRAQYIGEEVIIAPSAKIRVDDARGRHVLNILGPRGLVTLEYGDEGDGEEKKAEIGRKRNHDFKYKQVIDFNTLNEQRFQSRLPYLRPPKHIKEYANELGIELRQPYAVPDAAKQDMAKAMERNQELEREVKQKDSELSELQAQMAELTGQFKQVLAALGQKQKAEETAAELAGKWNHMGSNVLATWIAKNWEQIRLLPDKDFKDLQDRYQKVYGKKMPAEPEEVEQAA
jgi:vacuolar-type H+-ATPase subunit I/STV1